MHLRVFISTPERCDRACQSAQMQLLMKPCLLLCLQQRPAVCTSRENSKNKHIRQVAATGDCTCCLLVGRDVWLFLQYP
jgi:hypothetical protein